MDSHQHVDGITAPAILEACLRDGIKLSMNGDGRLQYCGPKYAVSYWWPFLLTHQEIIGAELRRRQESPAQSRRWAIERLGTDTTEVFDFMQPVDQAAALALHDDAMAAWPVP